MAEVLSYVCPSCGSTARVGKPCPGCMKKVKKPKRRSWEEDGPQDGLDLPDDDFDYDDFVAREFGKIPHRQTGLKWYWWLLAVALLAGMIATALFIR
jgi:predicted Abi (CAAX) family protease